MPRSSSRADRPTAGATSPCPGNIRQRLDRLSNEVGRTWKRCRRQLRLFFERGFVPLEEGSRHVEKVGRGILRRAELERWIIRAFGERGEVLLGCLENAVGSRRGDEIAPSPSCTGAINVWMAPGIEHRNRSNVRRHELFPEVRLVAYRVQVVVGVVRPVSY